MQLREGFDANFSVEVITPGLVKLRHPVYINVCGDEVLMTSPSKNKTFLFHYLTGTQRISVPMIVQNSAAIRCPIVAKQIWVEMAGNMVPYSESNVKIVGDEVVIDTKPKQFNILFKLKVQTISGLSVFEPMHIEVDCGLVTNILLISKLQQVDIPMNALESFSISASATPDTPYC